MELRSRRNPAQDTIRLDAEGNWYQGEYPILHERTCQFFHKHIAMDDEGRYYLTGEDKPVYIQVEDVPYWVTKLERTIAGFLVNLTDESIELLDLNSIWIGTKNALYCLVKQGTQAAKFSRSAYYEMMKELEQSGKNFYITFKGKKYTISNKAPKILFEIKKRAKKKPPKKTKRKPARKTSFRPAQAKKTAPKKVKKAAPKKGKKKDAKKLKKAAKKKKITKKRKKKK